MDENVKEEKNEEELTGLPPELPPNENPKEESLEDTMTGFSTMQPEDLTIFSTYDNSDATIQKAQRLADAASGETSTFDVLGAAWNNTSITQNLWDTFSTGSTYDPEFKPTDEHWKELDTSGLSEDQKNDFYSVFSDQDWQTKKERYEQAIEADQMLSSAGWGGVGAQIMMSVLDPPALIAGALSGGALNAILGAKRAASLGMASKVLLQGGIAAAENAALEAALVKLKPTGKSEDILYAALGGAAFGAAFGAAGRVFTKTEDDGIYRALNKTKDAVHNKADGETIGGSGASGGAAHVTSPNEAISDAAEEHVRQVRLDGDVAPTEFSAIRFDATGQLIASDHPLARDMSKLAEDGVGKSDGSVNVFSASERQSKLHGTMMLKLNRAFGDNYKSWAEEQGINKFYSRFDKDRKRFGEEVTAATREAFPDNLSPSVKAAAQSQRKFYAEYAYLANNPLANEGAIAKAVRGFENLIVNPDYVPRIHDPRKMTALIQQFGHTNMGRAVGQAMRAINSDITEAVADKLGKAYIKSIQRHQLSSASASRQLSGEDLDGLREMLEESRNYDNLDLGDDDIDMLINSLTKKAKSDTKHGRSRLLFDEKFSVMIRPISGTEPVLFRMSDMFDNNAETLAENYSRTMSGEIALRQIGIDGIRDINKTIQHIRETTHLYDKKDKSETDIKNIEYLATNILGRPVGDSGAHLFSARNSTFGKAQRLISDFNIIRVLGRVGEAQLVEIGNLLSTKNFKAFIQSMPTFRDFMTNASGMKRSDPIFAELEIATGIGADGIQGSYLNNIDEFGGGLAERSGIAAGLELGKRAVFLGSGMRHINNFLQKMSMRTIVQRFANAAHTGDLDKAFSLKDLSAMGLSKDDALAILGQIKKHSKNRKGAITGNRVHELKWDKWDIDTKAKFENAIYRESRRLVQQNDVGTTHRVQGTPLGKMFFQFRSFLLSAWTKQTLHNIHKRDWDAFSKMAIQTFVGSLVFVGQTHYNASKKDDPQEYINKRLKGEDGDEPWRVIAGGFAKSGFSGFIPMAVDGAMSFTHEDPIFNARSSGLSSTGLLSNPTLDLADKAIGAASGAVSAALTDDYEYSKVDARALKALIPFQNMLAVDKILNSVFEDLPERSQDFQFKY